MIELERHIEVLLLKSDCVIVPGLGGFVANHIPARYDMNDNTFIPPLRTLGFNPKLSINDSLLVQSYSETYDISYPEAYNRIESEVNELKQHVENTGSYDLNNIGSLYMNSDGNLEFSPCEAGILTPSLYSLSSFEMTKTAKTCVADRETGSKKVVKAPLSVNAVKNPSAFDVFDGGGSNVGNNQAHDKRVCAIRNFVAAAVAVILFLVLGTPVNENSSMVKTSNMDNGIFQKLVNDGYNKIKEKKSINLEINSDKETKVTTTAITEVNQDNAENVKAEVKDNVPTNYFCIVLASQVSMKNAVAFVEKIGKQGYDKAHVLTEKNRSVKVVYGQYGSQRDAYNDLNNLRSNDLFCEAWVYQVRN